MNLISICLLLIMTTLTGSIVFCLWKIGSSILEEGEKILGIRAGLIFTTVSFLFPFLFLYKAHEVRLFLDGNTGPLFWNTPVLILIGRGVFLAWAGGFLWKSFKMRKNRKVLETILRGSKPAGRAIQETAGQIQENMHISKRIPVYLTAEKIGPMIVGTRNCRILLPLKTYEKQELQIILEHELWHYRQGDLFLKKLCVWIGRIHWFNPLIKLLCEEVNKWGDIHCDLRMCCEGEHFWDRKQYFLTILEHAPEHRELSSFGMGLGKTGEEMKKRIAKMKQYNHKKELGRTVLLLLAAGFLLTASVMSLAAGTVVENIYNVVYEATEKTVDEEPALPAEFFTESTWKVTDDTAVTETDEPLNARGSSIYSWTMSEGSMKKTGSFYAKEGSKVAVSVNPDPMQTYTSFGLDQPDGYLRGISLPGAGVHVFEIKEDGNYKVYVRNESSKAVTANVSVVVQNTDRTK